MNEDGIVVLSLFDGMSCGQIAFVEANIKIKKYYASEVDKHAIAQTKLNFPNTIHLGDVRNIDVSKLDYIDIVIGGSPCQSFSFAGKRNGMSTKCEVEIYSLEKYLELKEQGFEFEGQSYLFWEYMRILNDVRKYNPDVKFLLENVEMGNKWERILSEAIGVFGVHINSALVSAQNRKRIYWTNIRTRQQGLFCELHSDIPQPKDRGILLKDILESEVDEKYYIKNPKFGFDGMDISGKSNTMRIGGHASQSNKHNLDIVKVDKNLNPKHDQDKASCFTAGGNSGGNHSDMDLICVSMVGRKLDENGVRKDNRDIKAVQRLEPNMNGKTNCLTSVQKDNLVLCLTPKRTDYGKQIRKQYEAGEVSAMRKEVSQLEPREDGKTNTITTVQKDNLVIQLNPSKESNGKQPFQQNRVYSTDGISPCISTTDQTPNIICHNMMPRSSKSGKGGTGHLTRSDVKTYCLDTGQTNAVEMTSRIRRLTPIECARLQTIPAWYKWKFVESNYFGYICSVTKKTIICKANVTPMAVSEQFQISQLDCATCTTLDLLELEKQRVEKLTKQKNVKLMAAIETLKQNNTETYVSCITKDFIDTERGNFQSNNILKNASFVINKLEVEELMECVPVIIEVSNSMEILLMLKKESRIQNNQLNQQDIMGVKIKNKDTKMSWSVSWGEDLMKERLYTILTLINWIIDMKIYTYAKDVLNIHLSIGNLSVLEQNYISVELSNLRMESIISCSDTQQYKMLGNGWSIEVIKHIFSFIKNDRYEKDSVVHIQDNKYCK